MRLPARQSTLRRARNRLLRATHSPGITRGGPHRCRHSVCLSGHRATEATEGHRAQPQRQDIGPDRPRVGPCCTEAHGACRAPKSQAPWKRLTVWHVKAHEVESGWVLGAAGATAARCVQSAWQATTQVMQALPVDCYLGKAVQAIYPL
jgi:hypothetical protein